MWEYLDKGILLMSFLILCTYLALYIFSKKDKILITGLIALFITSVFGNILIAVSNYNKANTSIRSFVANNAIYCTHNSSKYKVSKSNNWQLEKIYFIKDSLMIKANECQLTY